MTNGRAIGHRQPWLTDRFHLGVCYYPEHWDDATRADDARRMSEAGVTVVRMAEFAWDLMEPEPGRHDFGLFDQTIAQLAAYGISTILCTPTAAPPRWLTLKHPGILRVDARGARLHHGSRQHACTANPTFRHHSRSITEAMARHWSDIPSVIGWQTDNEFHCHFSECHCPSCQDAFRAWLRASHGDIAHLNAAWGTPFWAQRLSDFEEAETPRDGRPTHQNPGARLDYQRFLSDAVTAFQREQVDILRSAQPSWFVFHNGLYGNIDYRGGFGRDLDVLGVDIYPMFTSDPAQRPFVQAVNADAARCLGGNFIVPEMQAGPGGQPGYLLDTPAPGEMRQMAYAAIARGADSLLFFRWRSCRFGAEEYWCGIIDHDNVPRRRWRELGRIGDEISRIGPNVLGTTVRVDAAIAWGDFDAQSAASSYPAGTPGDLAARDVVHQALMRRGYAVGLVHPEDDLTGIRMYWIPHWELFKPAWVEGLRAWVEAGGVLVVGARTGTRDSCNRIVSESWPGCLRGLLGVTVEEFGRINHPASCTLGLSLPTGTLPAEHWYEVLEPHPGTSTLASWQGGHCAGRAAITCRRVGRGSAIYVGTWSSEPVVAALLPSLAASAGLEPLPGSAEGIQITCRASAERRIWFLFNHRSETATVRVPESGRELCSDTPVADQIRLEPHGAAAILVEGGRSA